MAPIDLPTNRPARPTSRQRGGTRGRPRTLPVAAAGALALLLASCAGDSGGDGGEQAGPTGGAGGEVAAADRLQVVAPADPGGGWDQSARALAAAMEEEGLARSVQVSNVGGAGGTVGLAQLATESSEDVLMIMGLVMVGAIETNQSQATLQDTTPLARLTAEDQIVVVPAESPHESIDDLVADMRERGREVSIAGGSAGGTDHILAALIAQEAGVPVEDLNYVAYSGGGESLAALLGNQVSAGISGVAEYAQQVEAGELRALATSGDEPVPGLGAPTLVEAGLDIELTNWRGVVAPPGLSDEGRERLLGIVEAAHASPAWQEQLERNGWEDTYLAGEDFEAFLDEEQVRVRAVLEDIGLVE